MVIGGFKGGSRWGCPGLIHPRSESTRAVRVGLLREKMCEGKIFVEHLDNGSPLGKIARTGKIIIARDGTVWVHDHPWYCRRGGSYDEPYGEREPMQLMTSNRHLHDKIFQDYQLTEVQQAKLRGLIAKNK